MPPEYVRPYVKAHKNDDRGAEAIAEAATRRFVKLKSEQQLDMQPLRRARGRLVGERTALINPLRAILMERGIAVPQGRRKLEKRLVTLIDGKQAAGVTPRAVKLIADMREEWSEPGRRIEEFDAEFAAFAKADQDARLLVSIPGIGGMIAPALIAAAGKAESFAKGRDLAAWPGLVPEQFSAGGRPKLLRISKRGNKYLRKLLIHGARSALPHLAGRATPLGRWAKGLLPRAHKNAAAVALASKLARIAWAVLRRGERFAAKGLAVAAEALAGRSLARPANDVCLGRKRDRLKAETASWKPGTKCGALTP